jgi:hypothetical protein
MKNIALILLGVLLFESSFRSSCADPIQVKQDKNLTRLAPAVPYSGVVGPTVVNSSTGDSQVLALASGQQAQGPDAGKIVLLSSEGAATTDLIQAGTTTSSPLPATVTISGQKFGLAPNPSGVYPRLTTPGQSAIPIHLNTTANASVYVLVLDGGLLGNKQTTATVKADSTGNIDFTYSVPNDPGAHRLAIFEGSQKQTLNFWVGPPLSMRTDITAAK